MLKFIEELNQLHGDYSSRLHTCMQTLKGATVGDTAKSYFYGESLYLQSTLDRLEYLIRLYRTEHGNT